MGVQDGIFGTPPEPLFNDVAGSLKDDGLDDCLRVLKQQNLKSVKIGWNGMGCFKNDANAQTMFLICEHFGLVEHAKYLAMEIYDRFMARHVQQLFDHVKQSSSRTKKKDWKVVLERVRSQSFLRMLTSIQLATKLTSHYKILSVKKAWNLLNRFGQHYTTDGIINSEIRILKVLNFDVMLLHPLIYVETLLEIMSRRFTSLDIKLYYVSSMHFLDLAYLERQTMYNMLYTAATEKPMPPTKEDKAEFRVVEQDNLLLAVSVIVAAAHIIDAGKFHKVSELLVEKTDIPLDDMLDFATVLLKTAQCDTEM